MPSCRSWRLKVQEEGWGNETTGVACSHARNGMVKVRCLSNRENTLCKHTASSVTLLLPLTNQVQSFTRQVVPVPMTTAATKSCARLLVTLSPASVGLPSCYSAHVPWSYAVNFLKNLKILEILSCNYRRWELNTFRPLDIPGASPFIFLNS